MNYSETEKPKRPPVGSRPVILVPGPRRRINLGLLYKIQGQYAEAAPLYKRALKIKEKALGPDHPSVATSLNNLGLLYRAQGQYAKAEPLFKQALKIYEKALGPDHSSVATSLNSLAGLYRATNRDEEAEALELRAARIRAIER